ncbi:MAG: ROK family protein [Acetatifactor sp.]
MKYYLGLDVGGTNLAAGVVDEEYHLISKVSIPSGAGRSMEEITADMERVTRSAIQKAGLTVEEFETWGIGMPSYVNPKTDLLVHANCFGWRNVPIYQYLEDKLPLKVLIENDANCAALGETLAGAAKEEENVIMLTLGTGVGGGVIIDKKIYCGADMMGAELGHAKLVYNGITCTCGQKGCVEAYCSATALIRQTREAAMSNKTSVLWELCNGDMERIEGKTLFEAVKLSDPTAEQVLEQYIEYLSSAISTYITLFRPDKIILGGGIAEAGELLLDPLQQRLVPNTFAGTEIGVPKIVKAKLGNDAGIIGAAFLEKYGVKRRRTQNDR